MSNIEPIYFNPESKESFKKAWSARKERINGKQYSQYDVEKAIKETYEECIRICKNSVANWSIKDPSLMALHCARLIEGSYYKKGITPRFSKDFINELKAKKILK